jgi:hypothetical protein
VWSPSDTNVIDSVYMENPAVYDLKFGVRNYYQFLSASNPCVNYNQTITMAFSLSSDSVAAYNQFNTCVRFLSKGDTIGNQLKFSRSGYIDTNVHNQLPFNCNFTGEQYLAIKKTVGKRTFYGWVLIERIGSYGIIIKESALNKSDDRPIICGQTK